MSIFSAVQCWEEEDSYRENFSLEAFEANINLRCTWANRYNLVGDLIFNARHWPFIAPSLAPRASRCSIMPSGLPESNIVTGQSLNYADAIVGVTYTQSHGTEDNGGNITIFSEELEPTAEFTTLDHTEFRWGDAGGDPLVEAEAPGLLKRGFHYVKTYFFVQSIPPAIMTLIGHTNADPIVSPMLGLTFAPETLLYSPPNLSRSISTMTGPAWTVKLKFSYKPEGWNKFWRAQTQDYEEIVVYKSDEVYKSYPLGDYSPLVMMGV